MMRQLSRLLLHDKALLEQQCRVCLFQLESLRCMPTMATVSDGTSLSVTGAPSAGEGTEDILNADSKAAWTSSTADIKGGQKRGNKHLARMMRSNLASEAAAVRMFGVQSRLGGKRPDLEFFKVRSIP